MTEIERLNERINDLATQTAHAEDQAWFALHDGMATRWLFVSLLFDLDAKGMVDVNAFIAAAPMRMPPNWKEPTREAALRLLASISKAPDSASH